MRTLTLIRAAAAAVLLAALPVQSPAQVYVGIGISVPPPAIPVYTQPVLANPNYMWQPGYWAWGPGGYYWVPGTWVPAPQPGYLWTPGYWGFNNGAYYWNDGFWGPTVGFYGGINYGFGYYGTGFVGGQWSGGAFSYNTAIMNVNRTVIHNVYINKTVINRTVINRTSYNGGEHGVQLKETPDQVAMRKRGVAPTNMQRDHEKVAAQDRNHYSSVNQGHPQHTAVTHPYSASHQPEHAEKVTDSDRAAANKMVSHPQQQHKPPVK